MYCFARADLQGFDQRLRENGDLPFDKRMSHFDRRVAGFETRIFSEFCRGLEIRQSV